LIRNSISVIFCFVFLSFAMIGIMNQNQTTIYISEPDDIIYTEGATGNYIVWNVSFNVTLHYSIQRNYTILNVGSGDLGSNSGNITICVDGLPVGIWYYLLIVDDYGENVASDLVIVTVNQPDSSILFFILSIALLISAILVFSAWRMRK
jgi:hypothetical protein